MRRVDLPSKPRWTASNWKFCLLFYSFALIAEAKCAVCNFGPHDKKIDLQTLPYIVNLAYTFNNVMLQGLSWLLGLQLRLLTKLSFHHSRPITVLITLAATPICMSISVLPSLMNKIPRTLLLEVVLPSLPRVGFSGPSSMALDLEVLIFIPAVNHWSVWGQKSHIIPKQWDPQVTIAPPMHLHLQILHIKMKNSTGDKG